MGINDIANSIDQNKAARLLRVLRAVELDLGLPLLLSLAAVACEPGISVNNLAERIGVPQQTASRYLALLQGRYSMPDRDIGPEPLIKVEINPIDPRRRALKLTKAGAKRLSLALAALFNDEKDFSL